MGSTNDQSYTRWDKATEALHTEFCKMILKLQRRTNNACRAELSRFPLIINIQKYPSKHLHIIALFFYCFHCPHCPQTAGSPGQRRTGSPTEPGVSQGFFLHSVTDGVLVPCRCRRLLSWEHLISSDIADLIAQILFKLK